MRVREAPSVAGREGIKVLYVDGFEVGEGVIGCARTVVG
jgi:hypothetical protein